MKYPKEIKSMINHVRKLDGKPNGVIPRLKDDWYLIILLDKSKNLYKRKRKIDVDK